MAKITMREAISQALMEEMDRDPKVFIMGEEVGVWGGTYACLLYTSPSPRDRTRSRMPSSA